MSPGGEHSHCAACVLGQIFVLSWCVSPPRCIIGYSVNLMQGVVEDYHPIQREYTETFLVASCYMKTREKRRPEGPLTYLPVPIFTFLANNGILFLQGKIEMLRRVDLQAVLKSDVTIRLYRQRPLPRPIASLPRKKGSNMTYINVGSLQSGDSWVGVRRIKHFEKLVFLPFIDGLTLFSKWVFKLLRRKEIMSIDQEICFPNIAEEPKFIHRVCRSVSRRGSR